MQTNLKNSFPEKSEKNLKSIEKKFYRHLADLFIETFKLTHMCKVRTAEAFTVSNLKYLKGSMMKNVILLPFSVIIITGNGLSLIFHTQDIRQYQFTNHCRTNISIISLIISGSQHGMVLTPMSMIIREIINDRKAKY